MVGAGFPYLGHAMEITNQKLCVGMLILPQRQILIFTLIHLQGSLLIQTVPCYFLSVVALSLFLFLACLGWTEYILFYLD